MFKTYMLYLSFSTKRQKKAPPGGGALNLVSSLVLTGMQRLTM